MARRQRDYAAERAAARARAAALGLSPSAALGKPRKGEQSKRAAGVDMRTSAGRAAATAKAVAAGVELPAARPAVVKAKAGGRQMRASSSPDVLATSVIGNLRGSRNVQVVIEARDPKTGVTRTIEPWRKGGIKAAELQNLLEDWENRLIDAIDGAMGAGNAGDTDQSALAGEIVNVTVSYV